MGGHLWKVHELTGGDFKLIVTTSNSEEQARQLFRNVFGSSTNIYKVEYLSFVHAVQG